MNKLPQATALTQTAYIVGVHHYSFRVGQAAEILGIKYVKPFGKDRFNQPYEWRLAYIVKYDDNVIDYVAISDVENGNYAIISDYELASR